MVSTDPTYIGMTVEKALLHIERSVIYCNTSDPGVGETLERLYEIRNELKDSIAAS